VQCRQLGAYVFCHNEFAKNESPRTKSSTPNRLLGNPRKTSRSVWSPRDVRQEPIASSDGIRDSSIASKPRQGATDGAIERLPSLRDFRATTFWPAFRTINRWGCCRSPKGLKDRFLIARHSPATMQIQRCCAGNQPRNSQGKRDVDQAILVQRRKKGPRILCRGSGTFWFWGGGLASLDCTPFEAEKRRSDEIERRQSRARRCQTGRRGTQVGPESTACDDRSF